jgi:hypothetical protein
MRRLLVFLVSVAAFSGLSATAATAAPARAEKLTPIELKWVTPMITVWNTMNAGLHLIYTQAAATDALIAGSPNNLTLTKTLVAFVECSPAVKKVGAPPSPRLQPFADTLKTTCVHLATGANDMAKAIGAIHKKNGKLAASLIKQMGPELKTATSLLSKAQKQLVTIGGKNIFAA